MKLNNKTIEKLRKLINEETEYRSGPRLVDFFNSLGFGDSYGQGFPSRWYYTEEKLNQINGGEKIKDCILNLLSPINFIGDNRKLDDIILDFNQYLFFDNYKIIRKESSIELIDLDNKFSNVNKNQYSRFLSNAATDYEKFLDPFTKENFYKFKCPFCGKGFFEIDENSFCMKQTENSKIAYKEINDIEFIELKYVTFLKCNNKSCNEIATISGIGKVDYTSQTSLDGDPFVEQYTINYFNPAPDIIDIPIQTPEDVRLVIKEAFALFWADPSSCGNKIRKTLEILMDKMGVQKKNLHDKIVEFGLIENLKYKELSKLLIGVKWFGNYGSHRDGLSRRDVLDAFDVLNFVVYNLFAKELYQKDIETKAEKLKNFKNK